MSLDEQMGTIVVWIECCVSSDGFDDNVESMSFGVYGCGLGMEMQ